MYSNSEDPDETVRRLSLPVLTGDRVLAGDINEMLFSSPNNLFNPDFFLQYDICFWFCYYIQGSGTHCLIYNSQLSATGMGGGGIFTETILPQK